MFEPGGWFVVCILKPIATGAAYVAGISLYAVFLLAIFFVPLWLGQKYCRHDRVYDSPTRGRICRRCGKEFGRRR